MSIQDENKEIVGRWFTSFWGKTCDLTIVDELAAPLRIVPPTRGDPPWGIS